MPGFLISNPGLYELMHRAKRLFIVGRGFRSLIKAAREWVETMEIETGQIPEAYVLVDAVDASTL